MNKPTKLAEDGNVYLNRIVGRLADTSDRLLNVATSLEGRHRLTEAELDDLRHNVGEAARSLEVVEAISRHFAVDLTTSADLADRTVEAAHEAARNEDQFRAVVISALAGEVRS